MAFWGIELEPGEPFSHHFENALGRLHITRATLGVGWSTERSVVQCQVGDKPAIFLCSLRSPKKESCQLDIWFEGKDDVVFEVLGLQSVHLTGSYFQNGRSGDDGDYGAYEDVEVESEVGKMKKSKAQGTENEETEVDGLQVKRTLASGLVIEDLEMGHHQRNKRIAIPKSQVSVHYFGQLKSDGFVFDSNFGKFPYRFTLGIGAEIKGWDVGINGMRVGDKRRLTFPPSMGYGNEGSIPKGVPPNAWLVYEVEVVDIY